MVRSLMEIVLGALVGSAFGALLAGPLGAVLGALLGSLFGSAWRMGVVSFARQPSAAGVIHERHDVMCIPKGELAHCVVTRNAGSGEWLDVEECSLCAEPGHVSCTKRCLVMLDEARPSPVKPAA